MATKTPRQTAPAEKEAIKSPGRPAGKKKDAATKAALLAQAVNQQDSKADVEARRTRLKNLIMLGKERGYLTYAEVNDHLPDEMLDAEQIESVISMINDMGIQVFDQAPAAEELLMSETPAPVADEDAAEEAEAALSSVDAEFGRTTDPVRMYMREMGTKDLLTREGEIEIAKRIEEGLKHMVQAISACPLTIVQILELVDKVEKDELNLDRQEVHQPRPAVPRPHPGRQHRPDEGGGQVRIPPRLQVLDLRHVVDPPGHHALDRRPGAHHPHPGAHDRDDQQDEPHQPPDPAGDRPGARSRDAGEKMEMPEEKIRKILKISKEPISMETPIGDDDDSHLGDFIEDTATLSPADAAMFAGLRDVTKEVLDSLTPREAKVLRMRFGIEMNTDHTLEEVGKQFDVTRERIRQIEAKALRKLRHPSRSEKLRSFLECTKRNSDSPKATPPHTAPPGAPSIPPPDHP
jgi:RNA polymerase sigma factor (sigma-70 family)